MNFGEKKINESVFYKNKKPFKIDDIDVDKISYGTKKSIKYFISYNDNDVIRPLCIMIPQMIGYLKCFDSNKIMSFNVTDKKAVRKLYQSMGKS